MVLPHWKNPLKDNAPLSIALGAGVYWAATLYGFIADEQLQLQGGLNAPFSWSWVFVQCSAVGVALIAFLLSTRFRSAKWQTALAVAAMLLSLAYGLLSLALPTDVWGPLALARLILLGASGSCMMLFWGLTFASLNKETAEHTVIITSLFCGTVLFVLLIPQLKAVSYALALLLRTFSPLLFLLKNYRIVTVDRKFNGKKIDKLVTFATSRLLLGLSIGMVSYLVYAIPSPVEANNPLLFIVMAGLSLGLGLRFLVSERAGVSTLAILPMLLTFGLILCFFNPHYLPGTMRRLAPVVIWFSWISLSSTQLSELKEEFGLNEVFLSFAEKMALSGSWLMGCFIGSALVHEIASSELRELIVNYSPALLMAVWLIFSVFNFVQLTSTKERAKAIDKALDISEKQVKEIHDLIASDFALSSREREILDPLVEGHSRSYIGDYFFLSPSTVKAHVSHIYQKLDIHKREELFEIVEKYRVMHSEQKRYGE
jgi:DNA-binding CsgD family transcriptional regulator